MVILAQIQVGLPEVVEGRSNITRDLDFLPDPESLLKIGSRVLILALGEVGVPNVIEGQTFGTFIPCFALNLEGFLRRLQVLVVLSEIIVKIAQIHQVVAEPFLVVDLPSQLDGLLVIC